MVAVEQPRLSLPELAKSIEAAQRKRRLEAHSRPWQPSMTPATSLGYECERRTVYQRTQPDKAQPVGEELASIFEEGDLHQKNVRAELLEIGFEVVESEVNFKDARLEISGTIDGKILVKDPSARHGFRRVPVEIKSTSGAAPADEQAWRNSESALLRRYYAQLQTYLYLTNEPEGLGIFKDKVTGLWSVVAMSLDYAYVEGLLQRAERIRDSVKANELPTRIASRSECGGCPFKDTICHPEQSGADPMLLAEDEALGAQLGRRAELAPLRREFETIDDEIKTRFKLTAGEAFVVNGRWLVEKRKHGKGVRIDIGPLPGDAK